MRQLRPMRREMMRMRRDQEGSGRPAVVRPGSATGCPTWTPCRSGSDFLQFTWGQLPQDPVQINRPRFRLPWYPLSSTWPKEPCRQRGARMGLVSPSIDCAWSVASARGEAAMCDISTPKSSPWASCRNER